jgi:hypothetical protein
MNLDPISEKGLGIFVFSNQEVEFMRKLFGCIFCVFVIACSTKSEVVKDTDYLKYGTRASVIERDRFNPILAQKVVSLRGR